ncbi:MAG: DUF1570 domain-containing protein [Planctomycetia bacterium]|nr:DUF1570 domain-containing protein [Planctomycetia bacterium]
MTLRNWIPIALVASCLPSGSCARWHSTPVLPARNSIVLDQLIVFSDSALPEHHRLLEELRSQRTLVSTKLRLPVSDEPIHIYLFPTAEKLDTFMRVNYPAMPQRRAFFVESDTRLSVYAYWGDRVAEDLRHEVAHGYLHAVVPHLPLWLDEGLAEYFEVPRGQNGVNRPHLDLLAEALSQNWRPDLQRLEQLRTTGEMTQIEYAESWAWAHFMLESSPERLDILQSYLQTLNKSQTPELISTALRRIDPAYVQNMADYILVLRQSLR